MLHSLPILHACTVGPPLEGLRCSGMLSVARSTLARLRAGKCFNGVLDNPQAELLLGAAGSASFLGLADGLSSS